MESHHLLDQDTDPPALREALALLRAEQENLQNLEINRARRRRQEKFIALIIGAVVLAGFLGLLLA